MTAPVVSVIVVTFNSAHLLAGCIAPIAARISSGEFELIVVDNASKDSPERAAESTGVPLTFVQSGKNRGFAVAVNIGARIARSELILLLNPDVDHDPHLLPSLVESIRQDPGIGAIAPLLETPGVETANGGRQPHVGRMLAHSSGLARLLRRRWPTLGHYAYADAIGARRVEVEWLSGGYLVTRARGGGQDLLSERWFMYAEDIDLGRSIRERGLRLVLCGDLRATHAIGGSSGNESAVVRTMWIENLRDYYDSALAPDSLRKLLWRVIVWTGYSMRAVGHSPSRVERRRAMSAYASAVWKKTDSLATQPNVDPLSSDSAS